MITIHGYMYHSKVLPCSVHVRKVDLELTNDVITLSEGDYKNVFGCSVDNENDNDEPEISCIIQDIVVGESRRRQRMSRLPKHLTDYICN